MKARRPARACAWGVVCMLHVHTRYRCIACCLVCTARYPLGYPKGTPACGIRLRTSKVRDVPAKSRSLACGSRRSHCRLSTASVRGRRRGRAGAGRFVWLPSTPDGPAATTVLQPRYCGLAFGSRRYCGRRLGGPRPGASPTAVRVHAAPATRRVRRVPRAGPAARVCTPAYIFRKLSAATTLSDIILVFNSHAL